MWGDGARLEPAKLNLTTMMWKDSIVQSARINGLRVRGFSSRSTINLPPAYTKDFTPLERSHIMTPDVAKRWKHLSTVAQEIPELMDCEVRLLIGCDLLESIGTTWRWAICHQGRLGLEHCWQLTTGRKVNGSYKSMPSGICQGNTFLQSYAVNCKYRI